MASSWTGPILNANNTSGSRQWNSFIPAGWGEGADYFRYYNDFTNTADYAAADWTITTVEAGGGSATEAIAGDEKGGALLITNDSNDNDSDSLQLNEETFDLTAGKRTWFDCRIKINDVDQVDFFMGLNITDTTPLVTSDRVGFQIDDEDASILCKSELNSTETSTDTGSDAVDDTYVRLSFYYDGSSVFFFVNGAEKAEHVSTDEIPNDENMAITIHFQNGEASAQNLTIDYIECIQER